MSLNSTNHALQRVSQKKTNSFRLLAILVVLLPSLVVVLIMFSLGLVPNSSVATYIDEDRLVHGFLLRSGDSFSYNDQHVDSSSMIRQWGCNRQEEIFTFVHIGKSGGGNIRPRIAFSAKNVTRTEWRKWDDHFYPMEHSKGKFCTSRFTNFRVKDTKWREAFEGTVECNATTPLGIMVACPGTMTDCGNCDIGGDFCGVVYVGHNLMGSELHWMNHHVLKNWWMSNKILYPELYAVIRDEIELQHPDNIWCNETQDKVPLNANEKYKRDKLFVEKCSRSRSNRIDQVLLDGEKNFAPIYASLPVLRSTLLREPWSWFLSKFFWHKREVPCDDIAAAVEFPKNHTGGFKAWLKRDGWLKQDAYLYLFYLCGEDCVARYEKGIASLDELEAQTADNLRNSFAVIGLLEEPEMFFDMIDARVAYMNMSASKVQGSRHSSGGGREKARCKAVYSDESFRTKLKEKLPVLGALERLYELGREVNRAQVEDLRRCSSDFRFKYPEDDD